MKTLDDWLKEFEKTFGKIHLKSTDEDVKDFLSTMYLEVREEALKEYMSWTD